MCEPASLATAALSIVGQQLFGGGGGKAPAPAAPAAPPTPQSAKTPDQAAMRKQTSNAAPTGTMLTGAAGVDPASLALGKNTLLGA